MTNISKYEIIINIFLSATQSKCENYLPEKIGGYGDIEVTVDKVAQRPGYLMHFLTLRVSKIILLPGYDVAKFLCLNKNGDKKYKPVMGNQGNTIYI